MRALVVRNAMCGGGLAYDVYVPLADAPDHIRAGNFTHVELFRSAGKRFETLLHYEDATLPLEQTLMECGWDKYMAGENHRKVARREMLRIARAVFPELNRFGDHLPALWTTGLLDKETSAEAWVSDCGAVLVAGNGVVA
jgi:hypothetical protein